MIQIDDTIISLDVFKEKFLCNLDACKGECCIEGDAGAPLEEEEVEQLKKVLPVIWEDLSSEAQAVIEKQGVCYKDEDGDLVTSIVNGKDCVFTCYDEKGCCYCAIEKAYRERKVDFYKPVSCHLYPIRVQKYSEFKAVNYHRWSVCKAAVLLGEKEDMPIYKFLKEPLVRKFGEDWYTELEIAAEEMKNRGII
ncbi:Protein of unknown function [Bacteroides luti]|uniref:DUF3109 family protein n=1 Tax=Bacteroides luti TaxID=1297750 RepID=A0A1M5A1D4_9BACE|nr:DUF3109 family protein [Bacteroides luti]SHF24103.1 Protein of unknown function [Bacteroides luti]